ncbi:hypothetical protein WSM22_13770 [Cytophagales bacterium WSM2-2]|nr:hypothetical protein WSM22_13770 [Cytophagales bacterium WSM2-2]
MTLVRKFFPLDKNYLLEEAQLRLQESLLAQLVEKVKLAFAQKNNPLGLQDAFSRKVSGYECQDLKPLHNFYQNISAVYRFKNSDNQLEFAWDGREHMDRYLEEWTSAFDSWIDEFCRQELFVQAVLDLTVFLPENRHADLAENRMNNFMLRQFGVKLHKTKGLVAMKVA